ncbi:ferric reductase-like transmembrane domain-containing protein [Streptomyces caniscabiei]|uniref:Cytochrome b/b6 domain-containing protein n=1 Tax=Streptomyces caniscabiei TaxID=2746961 RepID=A0ABU4MTD0_9ACTN|nr:ferric reductase-like transmembrane domain-containing protein [Streptomyces caniscabiei]MDX2943484.1 cytochrome b/b6 domain-containing protein [Streptomyces caniscabiei]MDX2949279.1 cytochrome b/b6 domain-containing protein [Streptomyces caniscabiei]MDX2983432.1 cytochrome b/b6 domain-containing protein [Streptomyces caniscabiei]MDX3008363.1 cytochrome b/b6 domain-containing protein [Streptomyces caniscabiei]MDX3040049.1 cytochrome b/b6 domain-containing protein [Streptomyces caniscabiei]
MNPRRSNSSLPQTGRSAYGIATAAALLLIPVSVLVGGDAYREFLDFGAGVLSLVSLTLSVLWGLVAQDRTLLTVRQRIIGQAVHRTTAIASVAFLVLHVSVKLALNHVSAIALFPFALGVTGSGALIGFGATAGSMMIFVAITGALRSNFASPAPVAARWRAMHMMAYPAWCFALVHGLYAGREAKPVFVILYSAGLLAVAVALLLRAAPREVKRQVVERVTAILGTDGQRPPEVDELVKSRSALQGLDETGGRREGGRRDGGQRDGMRDTGQFPLPGFGGGQGNPPLGDPLVPPQRAGASADSGPGFAAAYRAVSMTPRAQEPTAPYLTQQQPPLDMQPTQAMPRMDDGSTTGSTRWPAPSPPPVGEAPPSAYDPMQDTFAGQPLGGQSYQGGQAYPGQAYQGETYNTGANPVVPETSYGTAETNAPYGTYIPNDTYNSGPATETLSGYDDYQQPGSGEPWNAPSGGFK